MEPIPPFWFSQRQGKIEPAGTDVYQLTAPNLGTAFLTIRRTDDGWWHGVLRFEAAGEDKFVTERAYPTRQDGWQAAFELYRVHVVT